MAMQFRRGNEADLVPGNLKAGEPAFTLDTLKTFVGTGSGTSELLNTARYAKGDGSNPNKVDHAIAADSVVHSRNWQFPALQNGWSDDPTYGIAYCKINGVGFVVGTASGGIKTMGTVIFTLPVGYRPDCVVSKYCEPGTWIQIQPGGNVVIAVADTLNGWFTLGSISYPISD